MKKLLLSAALAFGVCGYSQIADGSVAPDFTATDLNGNVHTLSEYLAQGKTVILDISAAWCGPCWNFHQGHALDDLYKSFGPGGSEEIVVLFVEGDAGTANEMLYGTGVDGIGRPSQGNWVEGTSYPIIDDASIAALYDIGYFPTLFRICPDGIVNEINPSSAGSIRTGINNNCGMPTLTGVPNYAMAVDNSARTCVPSGALRGRVKNMSNPAMTSATVVLRDNGEVVETKNWTGYTPQFSTANVDFATIDLANGHDYTFEVTAINGNSSMFSSTEATGEIFVTIAEKPTTAQLTVTVLTDEYPDEMSFQILDDSNTVVHSGGPFEGAFEEFTSTFEVDLNTTKCYRVVLVDSYGDGWRYGGQGGITITAADQVVYENFPSAAFSAQNNTSAFKTEATMAVSDNDRATFSIYPNPSTGIFNLRTLSDADITVTDLSGKTVFTGKSMNDGSIIDLSALQTGMYLAKVKTASAEKVEKLIVK